MTVTLTFAFQSSKSKKSHVTKTSAMATVETQRGGTATIKLHAQVPLSQASSSVTVQVSSGKAHAKVEATEPVKRKKTTPAKFQEYLILPPSGSAAGSNKKV